jgi:hypothetical protein
LYQQSFSFAGLLSMSLARQAAREDDITRSTATMGEAHQPTWLSRKATGANRRVRTNN